MTCEPAIYIAEEGFAIRLENDILITPDGPVDLMANIPIEADAVEELMRKSRPKHKRAIRRPMGSRGAGIKNRSRNGHAVAAARR